MATEINAPEMTQDTGADIDIDTVLNPSEMEGTFRDSRECAALALIAGAGALLLSPPIPRPKKG